MIKAIQLPEDDIKQAIADAGRPGEASGSPLNRKPQRPVSGEGSGLKAEYFSG